MIFRTANEEETFTIGFEYAPKLVQGDVVLVKGILGAGKSVFIRGAIRGLGVEEAIPSPTFSIVNEYLATKHKPQYTIYHFDLYRINEPFELYEVGFEEFVYSDGISFIEWPSKGGDIIPENAIEVSIEVMGSFREITIEVPLNINAKHKY